LKISKRLSRLGLCFLLVLLFVATPRVIAWQMAASSNHPNSQSSEVVPGTIWSHSYGGPYREMCRSVIEVSTGGFAMVGDACQTSPAVPLIWLLRTDDSGNQLWNRTYSNILSRGNSLVECSGGGFAIAGNFEYLDPATQILYLRGWLIRTDTEGNHLWNISFGDYADYCSFTEMVECSDGGFVLFGHIRLAGGNVDYYLARIDSEGSLLWERTYGDTKDEFACTHGLILCSDGGFALLGYPISESSPMVMMRTDSEGSQLWNQTYLNVEGNCILALDDGFLITGRSVSDIGAYEGPVLMRINVDGDLRWKRTYGHHAIRIGSHTGTASGISVVQSSNGGFSIAGFCYGPIGPNAWLMRTDDNGVYLWDQQYPLSDWDEAQDMIEFSDGGFVMAGYTLKNSESYDWDLLLMRVADQPPISPSRVVTIGLGAGFAIVMTILVLRRRNRWSEK
jgi:hypothetical protein